MLPIFTKKKKLADSFLKLRGLSTSSTVTHRMEEPVFSCIHPDDTYSMQSKISQKEIASSTLTKSISDTMIYFFTITK